MKNVEVTFPLIEDIKMEVANTFGMIQSGQSTTQAVRAVFVLSPYNRWFLWCCKRTNGK
ncbi:MAG: hypothetical protein ACERKN_15430 [Velocimicrobium sp.]